MALPPPGRTLRVIGFDDVPWRHRRAGPVHVSGPFVYQVQGADPPDVAAALRRLTDTGHVPEALRLAHVIGGALAYGQSGRRA